MMRGFAYGSIEIPRNRPPIYKQKVRNLTFSNLDSLTFLKKFIMSKSIDRFVKLLDEFGYDSVKNQMSEECPLTREFANFISSICANINKIVCTEENVNPVEKDDLQDWKLELGSFLRELQCPYDQLYTGELSIRLENFGDRLILVEFLHDELIAAQRVHSMSQNGDKNLNLQPIFGILNAIKACI